jgi:hypothetical protein
MNSVQPSLTTLILMRSFLIILSITFALTCRAQDLKLFHMFSSHTSFPDSGRLNGHLYDSVVYEATSHYQDSSVFVVVPKHLNAKSKLNMVFWFHGWHNNIDSAAIRYDLLHQFADTKMNAVLMLPETAKNAPDSYGGKLEKPGVFKKLVKDIILNLKKEKCIPSNCEVGNVILAGHSGAYRVMAYILEIGDIQVQEVILFDALYSETDKFITWMQSRKTHRFINMYTDNGGTDEETIRMMKHLKQNGIPYQTTEETTLTRKQIQQNRILFIHTPQQHNDIINNPDHFKLFIELCPFLVRIK